MLPDRLISHRAKRIFHSGLWLLLATPAAYAIASDNGSNVGGSRDPKELARFLGSWLMWSTVLLIAGVVGLVALLRFSRRMRQRLEPRSRRSDRTDVWSQHRLPDDWDAEPSPPESDSASDFDDSTDYDQD
jgi:hypothetical protein